MYRIGQVAAQLDIPPPTLRRLSERFARWLGAEAGAPPVQENGRRVPRGYTDQDVEILQLIQRLKGDGLSDEEIDSQLESSQGGTGGALAVVEAESNEELMTRTAAAALGQALHQLAETQQALLNSQQSQRDLLSVVINDAMSLKDENERLRKRLRVVEEEMARLKESDWNHRLSLEERMSQLERDEGRRSWWERLRGK